MNKVYIFLGPEKGLKEDRITEIKNSLGPCEVSRFHAFEDYENELYAQLGNNDLFADHKLVILENAEEIKTKDKTGPLAQYLKEPSDCATLIICSDELYIAQEIMSGVKGDAIEKFYELFENQKSQYLVNFFRKNNLGIESTACEAIIEKVENNIQEFNAVCSQIVIFVKTIEGKNTVTYQDVEDFLSHTRQETEFTLFSYIAKGRLDSALECLQSLLHSNDESSLAAVIASRLANYFRRTLSIEMKIQQGLGIDEALKSKFFDSDRPITMPKDKGIYKDAVQRYNMRDIKRILVTLAEFDLKVKEYGTAVQQAILEQCLIRIICYKGKHPKKVELLKL